MQSTHGSTQLAPPACYQYLRFNDGQSWRLQRKKCEQHRMNECSQANFGGMRLALVANISQSVRVEHTVLPNEALYRSNLWLNFVCQSKNASVVQDALWYTPGHSLVFSDTRDLYEYTGYPTCKSSACRVNKVDGMRHATHVLRQQRFDTVIFTSHLDDDQMHLPLSERWLRPELFAVSSWQPLGPCPAHPALHRGTTAVITPTTQRCPCRIEQPIGLVCHQPHVRGLCQNWSRNIGWLRSHSKIC